MNIMQEFSNTLLVEYIAEVIRKALTISNNIEVSLDTLEDDLTTLISKYIS